MADCPLRPSLAGQWWLSLSESCAVELHWGPCGGWPCQWVGLGQEKEGEEGGEGGSALERAGDTVGAENLSSGPFSADQVSTPHARVYIASGNKLWGNLILLEVAGWLSSHSGSPVASHQATVSPLLWVCITSSTVLNRPSLTSPPTSVKPVQWRSGFTDAADKALWRQPCRPCMKQKEDRLTWAAPWAWCVWNALKKERRISPLLRGRHRYFCRPPSSPHVTLSLLAHCGSVVGSSARIQLVSPPSTTHLTPILSLSLRSEQAWFISSDEWGW